MIYHYKQITKGENLIRRLVSINEEEWKFLQRHPSIHLSPLVRKAIRNLMDTYVTDRENSLTEPVKRVFNILQKNSTIAIPSLDYLHEIMTCSEKYGIKVLIGSLKKSLINLLGTL